VPSGRMHADELDTDASLARRLLEAQFPQWAGLPVERVHSAGTDNAIYRLGDGMAVRLACIPAAAAQWEAALQAPPHDGPPVWIHGDLQPGNLLAAWTPFTAEAREAFRAALGVDGATWARGRGWALSVTLIALPYYQHTNPFLVDVTRHTIREVLADPRHGA